MSDDLEKRLRDPSSVRSWAAADAQRIEAAAELARLRSENEALRHDIERQVQAASDLASEIVAHEAVRDECFTALGPSCLCWGDVPAHISALAGECERLRKVLSAIMADPMTMMRNSLCEKAQTALKEGADK